MTTCVDTLGPGAVLCNTNHCDQLQETSAFHAVCNCRDWKGNPIPDCNPKNNLYPVQSGQCVNEKTNEWKNVTLRECSQMGLPWYWQICYCCCSCFASQTPVAAPAGFRAIEDFAIGDEVLAAAKSGGGWSWTPQTVQFSSGSPASAGMGGNLMLSVVYGGEQVLIATANELFLLPDGKLKRADQLVPGTDSLVGEDGSSVAIDRILTGNYTGGVHHIATQVVSYRDFNGSIDNHLINANGVVVGDYLLQMFQDTDKMKPHIEPHAPVIGTREYAALNKDVIVKLGLAMAPGAAAALAQVSQPGFDPYEASATYIPPDAAALFSPAQEAMILDSDVPKRGFTDQTNVEQVRYYITLYRGFYPEVRVFLDWASTRPNVFAFEEYGQPTVVIAGEFLRLGPLYGPAMAAGIAFGIAGAMSIGESMGVGAALYEGIAVLMLTAFDTAWNATVLPAQSQLDTVLAALAPGEGAAAEGVQLSALCLGNVIDAAISGEELPKCAGGPLGSD